MNNLTQKQLEFRIWALQQDNLRRGDIIDRSKDPEHIKTVSENMRKAEKEIYKLLKMLNKEV